MAFDREAAKAEGYTDDEINAYQQAEAAKNNQTPVAADPGEPPAPTTVINPVGTSAAAMGTSAGLAIAPYAATAAGALGAGVGASRLYSGWKEGVNAANKMSAVSEANAATHAATQEMKTLQQIARGVGPEADAAKSRLTQLIQSRAAPVPTAPIAPTGGMPSGPVMPTGVPAAVPNAAPSVMNQLKSFAANKVLPMANSFAKGSVLSGLATYSPELGPQTPQVGRMKGSEINPLTSRPWTPDQIKQYEANPNAFDAQMAPPQMRR
jgi:hypothetical protein